MNDNDLNLLTSVYQNCKTAMQSIHDIETSIDDEGLRKELRKQLEQYTDFAKHCEEIADKSKQKLDDNNFFEKAKMWTSIKMATLTDKTTRHIAEMLLIGTVMGTLQCYKDMCDHRNAEQDLLILCADLLKMEESNFDYLKKFLKELQ